MHVCIRMYMCLTQEKVKPCTYIWYAFQIAECQSVETENANDDTLNRKCNMIIRVHFTNSNTVLSCPTLPAAYCDADDACTFEFCFIVSFTHVCSSITTFVLPQSIRIYLSRWILIKRRKSYCRWIRCSFTC